MKITNLYAELQSNPRSRAAYRKLAEHYRNCNQENIEKAFLYLMEKKFELPNNSNPDEE